MGHAASRLHRHTYAEYLELEAMSNVKHEFIDGEIFAMAGGTPEHAALAMAIGGSLTAQLANGACRVFSSDLRVRALATGVAAYPDVTVICGPLERDPSSALTVVNPTLIVEVTSDGTEDYDRGEKLDSYLAIPSLRACVIVSHRVARLDVVTRRDGAEWQRATFGPGQTAELTDPPCRLSVDAVYRGILGGL